MLFTREDKSKQDGLIHYVEASIESYDDTIRGIRNFLKEHLKEFSIVYRTNPMMDIRVNEYSQRAANEEDLWFQIYKRILPNFKCAYTVTYFDKVPNRDEVPTLILPKR